MASNDQILRRIAMDSDESMISSSQELSSSDVMEIECMANDPESGDSSPDLGETAFDQQRQPQRLNIIDGRMWQQEFMELNYKIEKAKKTFVEKPTYFKHDFHPVNKDELQIKIDVDGWKISYYPQGDQGLFDIIKPSLDTDIKVIMGTPRVPNGMIWRDSTAGGQTVRLGRFAGLKLAKLDRYVVI